MIFDNERTLRTINEAPNPYVIKIFFYLAFHQPNDGIRGYIIEKSQLQYDLQLGRTVFFDSLRWLKENLAVHELKLGDEVDFMVNPYIVMNAGDQNARISEWNRRQRLDMEREERLERERYLRKHRKSRKQQNQPQNQQNQQ